MLSRPSVVAEARAGVVAESINVVAESTCVVAEPWASYLLSRLM